MEINTSGLVIEQKLKKDKDSKTKSSSSSSPSTASSEMKHRILPVDTVVICAGQESFRSLYDECQKELVEKMKKKVYMIGGAYEVIINVKILMYCWVLLATELAYPYAISFLISILPCCVQIYILCM